MTLGNKSPRRNIITEENLIKTRLIEDYNAMKILGIKNENNIYLSFRNREIENSLQTIEALAKIIRQFKPYLVVAHKPENVIIQWKKNSSWVNHRDHRNAGKPVVDTCYLFSRGRLFFPNHFEDRLESHTVSEFLFVDYYDHSDFKTLEITYFIQTKIDALKAHFSQYGCGMAKESVEFITKIDYSDYKYERFSM